MLIAKVLEAKFEKWHVSFFFRRMYFFVIYCEYLHENLDITVSEVADYEKLQNLNGGFNMAGYNRQKIIYGKLDIKGRCF